MLRFMKHPTNKKPHECGATLLHRLKNLLLLCVSSRVSLFQPFLIHSTKPINIIIFHSTRAVNIDNNLFSNLTIRSPTAFYRFNIHFVSAGLSLYTSKLIKSKRGHCIERNPITWK